jgi:hypothetical protein
MATKNDSSVTLRRAQILAFYYTLILVYVGNTVVPNTIQVLKEFNLRN